MFLISSIFFAANCVTCPRICIYIHIVTFTTAATRKLWNSTLSHHAVTQRLVHAHTRPPAHAQSRNHTGSLPPPTNFHPLPLLLAFLPPSSSVLAPFPSLPAAPVSPIKDEQLYNNSRHDSLTLTLHIMELEVLGKPLMWESQVWTLGASPGNMMVPKRNKVCLS